MSERISKAEVARLRELERQATKGPWALQRPESDESEFFRRGVVIAAVARKQNIYADPPGGVAPESNRKLIAESRNLLPALLDTLDDAMAALGHAYYELDQRVIVIDCKCSNCARCERARALLADYAKEG